MEKNIEKEQPLITKLLEKKREREHTEYKRIVYVALDYMELDNVYIAICLRYMFDDDDMLKVCVNEEVDFARLKTETAVLIKNTTFPWWAAVVESSSSQTEYLDKMYAKFEGIENTERVKGVAASRDMRSGAIQLYGTTSLVGDAFEQIFGKPDTIYFKKITLKELSLPNPFKAPEKYMSSVELHNLKQCLVSAKRRIERLWDVFPTLKASFLVTLQEWQELVDFIRRPSPTTT